MTTSEGATQGPWGGFTPNGARKVSWGAATSAGASAPRAGAEAQSATGPAVAEAATLTSSPSDDLADLFGGTPAPMAGGLDQLFDPPAPKSPATPEGEPAAGALHGSGADLSDVFATAATATATQELENLFGAPDGTSEPATAPSLSDLFDPPEPEVTVVAEPTPLASVQPAAAPPAPSPALSFADAAATAPRNPFQPAEPAVPEAPASRVAAQRAHVDAARAAAPARAVASAESQGLAQDDRYRRADEFAPQVARLLALGSGSGDPALRSLIGRLELTRNHALDAEQRAAYQALLEPHMAANGMQMQTADDLRILFDIAYDEMLGIGPLGPLWRDDTITEIMVSGPHKVTVERRGQLELTPVRFRDLEHLEETARRIGQSSNDDRAISATNPLVTIQLPGARVQFVWRPLAVSKVAITIRKFGSLMGMDQLLGFGSLTEEMTQFLSDAVQARATVLVSGGTGSGKTTFINALSEFIPDTERVITIEDALELQLRNTHVEAFVTKEAASADDRVLFGQDQLLKASLRMRPDRIIVGEIRDAAGCAVMLEAANTGHAGTMTTIHANSPSKALKRMAGLLRRFEAMPDDVAKEEVGSAIDLVVQVVRTRGRRFVSAISVVDDNGNTADVFTGAFHAGAKSPTFSHVGDFGADTALALKMLDAGLDHGAWRR